MAAGKGILTVHGIDGTLAFSGVATTQNKLVGASISDEVSVVELRDGANNVVGAFASGQKRTCTFEVYIKGSSEANALSLIQFPAPLALVTIAGFGSNTNLNGDWNYVGGGTIALSTDNVWRLTLPCARYDQGSGTATALT